MGVGISSKRVGHGALQDELVVATPKCIYNCVGVVTRKIHQEKHNTRGEWLFLFQLDVADAAFYGEVDGVGGFAVGGVGVLAVFFF